MQVSKGLVLLLSANWIIFAPIGLVLVRRLQRAGYEKILGETICYTFETTVAYILVPTLLLLLGLGPASGGLAVGFRNGFILLHVPTGIAFLPFAWCAWAIYFYLRRKSPTFSKDAMQRKSLTIPALFVGGAASVGIWAIYFLVLWAIRPFTGYYMK